jgi:hypothetical protein
MGLISAITGNAGEVNVKKFASEFEPILRRDRGSEIGKAGTSPSALLR